MFTTVLPSDAQAALAILGKSGIVRHGYLAGGTALALQLGHRQSVDFDFFSDKEFDAIAMSRLLQKVGSFQADTVEKNTLLGTFNSVKYSYFYYPYPMIDKTRDYVDVAVVSIADIAAMKLVAISDRNTKKDFIDLYTLVQQGLDIEQMFAFYDQKYHMFDANKFTLIKSMNYFIDADADVMPQMLIPLSWDTVKKFFISESLRLGKIYLDDKT